MDLTRLDVLRCPECGGRLATANGHGGANFVCGTCRRTYPIHEGVPIFLPPGLSQNLRQVQTSFSAKWNRVPDIYDDDSFGTRHQHEWYLTRYRWASEERLKQFLATKQVVLDAGCGLGRDIRWYASLQPDAVVIGADLSEAVFHARQKSARYSNVLVLQADLNNLPVAPGSVDFVACDQVLSNVDDPRRSLERLWSYVKPGGHLAFYVYKRKAAIREFTDDLLRARITKMDPDGAWDACSNITKFGRALSNLHVTFDLPADIPELELKAGHYDLQRFIYYNMLKCFWNDSMTFDENNLVNLDWFHPRYTYRYSVDEVERWTDELAMRVLVLDPDDPSGISVLAEKPAV
jgi:SAM-dependent methyltransferase